jgi:hypothetical protein
MNTDNKNTEIEQCTIPSVSDCFSFVKYLNDNFQYYALTKNGDTYKDKDGHEYSEADIHDEWLNNR